jgi:hypothetical protein
MAIYYYTLVPRRGRGYTVLPLSVCLSFRPRYFSSHFSRQLSMAEIWYLVPSFMVAQTSIKYLSLNPAHDFQLMLTYDTPALRQTGSRNLTGQKTLPTIWGTYMKLVTKYQISVINSCWEKCHEKCAYMFNVYKNQLSRQTGSRNLTGPKTLPTIWHTYMKLGTKYQISAIDSCREKCDEKYLGRTDGQTDTGKTVYPLRSTYTSDHKKKDRK